MVDDLASVVFHYSAYFSVHRPFNLANPFGFVGHEVADGIVGVNIGIVLVLGGQFVASCNGGIITHFAESVVYTLVVLFIIAISQIIHELAQAVGSGKFFYVAVAVAIAPITGGIFSTSAPAVFQPLKFLCDFDSVELVVLVGKTHCPQTFNLLQSEDWNEKKAQVGNCVPKTCASGGGGRLAVWGTTRRRAKIVGSGFSFFFN